jgi:hypothetical protein
MWIDEVGNKRKLRKIEKGKLHNSYSSPNTTDFKVDGMGQACSTLGRKEKCICKFDQEI